MPDSRCQAIYLAYHNVPAGEVDATQIQQNCCYPDGSWWCIEPSHLERTQKNHVSPNVVKHAIPTAADAELPLLRRPREPGSAAVKRKDAVKKKARARVQATIGDGVASGRRQPPALGKRQLPTLSNGGVTTLTAQQMTQQAQFLRFSGGAQLLGGGEQHAMGIYNPIGNSDPQISLDGIGGPGAMAGRPGEAPAVLSFWNPTAMHVAQHGGSTTSQHAMGMQPGYPGQLQYQYLPQQQYHPQQQQQQMYAAHTHPGAVAQMHAHAHAHAEHAHAEAQARVQQAHSQAQPEPQSEPQHSQPRVSQVDSGRKRLCARIVRQAFGFSRAEVRGCCGCPVKERRIQTIMKWGMLRWLHPQHTKTSSLIAHVLVRAFVEPMGES